MHTLSKIFYLALFWCFDALLYFIFVKNNKKARMPLAIVVVVWLIVSVPYLLSFHVNQFVPLKTFGVLSAMVLQLIILFYVGGFAIRKFETATSLPEMVQQSAITWLE